MHRELLSALGPATRSHIFVRAADMKTPGDSDERSCRLADYITYMSGKWNNVSSKEDNEETRVYQEEECMV